MEEDKLVMFDSKGAIRVYDPEKFDETEKCLETNADFVSKMDQFKTAASATMKIVEQLGKAIEREKLRAIGSRNVVESETENRKRAHQEAQYRLFEKQAELDRYVAEYNALCKVEQEQRNIIQRLTGGMTE